MADILNGLFFQELIAQTARRSLGKDDDTCSPLKADRFIELGNASIAPVSLEGYQVWSERNGLLVRFGPNDVLDPGDVATIVENATGALPIGFYRANTPTPATTLPDTACSTADSIFLVEPKTSDYIALSYGNPPSVPGIPVHGTDQSPFPGINQIGNGENIQNIRPNALAVERGAAGKFTEKTRPPHISNMACFADDTVILTNRGEIPIGDLHPGDRIPTYDFGTQTLLGICRKHFSTGQLLQSPELRPLTLDHTLFGGDTPLRVSPAHCTLYRNTKAETLLSDAGILLRGHDLKDAGFAKMDIPRAGVTFYNLLFKNHVLVFANGIWSESYYNSPASQENKDWDAQWSMIPGVSLAKTRHKRTARPILSKHDAMVLLEGLKPTGVQRPGNTFRPISMRIVG